MMVLSLEDWQELDDHAASWLPQQESTRDYEAQTDGECDLLVI